MAWLSWTPGNGTRLIYRVFLAGLAGLRRKRLHFGDYSVAGIEDVCVVEQKHLDDLVHSFTVERPVLVDRLHRMSSYPHPLLVVTAALTQNKSPYPHSGTNFNRIVQSLIALLASLLVPFHDYGESRIGRGDCRLTPRSGPSV